MTFAQELATATLAVGAGLLIVAAVAKCGRPLPAANTLRVVGLPHGDSVVYGVAVAEAAVGIAWLIAPSRVAALAVAVLYTLLTAAGLRLRWLTSGQAPCGCLGGGGRFTLGHAAANGVVVVTAVALAVLGTTAARWDDPSAATALYVALLALGVYLATQAFNALDAVASALSTTGDPATHVAVPELSITEVHS